MVLLRLLLRIIVVGAAVIGFILYLVLDLHWLPESFLDQTPTWVRWVVLFCILCLCIARLPRSWSRPKGRPSYAKPH
jgi:hypothetical protein